MEETTSREKVLKKIRSSLLSKNENPFPSLDTESSVYQDIVDSYDITFAKEFSKSGGKFIYCEDKTDLVNNLLSLFSENKWEDIYCIDPHIQEVLKNTEIKIQSDPAKADEMKLGITNCEFLIARFGSIMISSRQASGRKPNILPDIHLVIARISQIVPDIKDALAEIRKKYENRLPSMITLITGPSRTADIEKTLVMGAHGPKELYVFLLDEE